MLERKDGNTLCHKERPLGGKADRSVEVRGFHYISNFLGSVSFSSLLPQTLRETSEVIPPNCITSHSDGNDLGRPLGGSSFQWAAHMHAPLSNLWTLATANTTCPRPQIVPLQLTRELSSTAQKFTRALRSQNKARWMSKGRRGMTTTELVLNKTGNRKQSQRSNIWQMKGRGV